METTMTTATDHTITDRKDPWYHKVLQLWQKTGPRLSRYRMYHDIEATLKDMTWPEPYQQIAGLKLLAISGSGDLTRLLHLPAHVTHSVFPKESILALTDHHQPDTYDYLMCDQVLEHVQGNMQQAVDECWRVLKPGGVCVLTTCLLQELHGLPHDYWRVTPNGLKYLFRDWREIVVASSWGNRIATLPFLGLRYIKVPHAKWHPLRKLAMWNETAAPVMTWIVVRK
jgi:SAM-dependent methyltransferase